MAAKTDVTKKKVIVTVPVKKTSSTKVIYHVSKRDNDGREWKVFLEGSDKVIKLFSTQAEALTYAKLLAANKPNATIKLHGLDGKIRSF